MSIITLLSDWGLSDYYAAAVRGRLYSEWPEARVVDISHQIPRDNIGAAAYVLKQAYPHFPTGSVHCIGVCDIASPQRPHVMVYDGGHFFIGTDNGIFTRLFDHRPEQAWRISLPADGPTDTFPSLNLFPLAAVHLAQGGEPDEIGEPYDWNGQNFTMQANAYMDIVQDPAGQRVGARITGQIIYTDSFGNGVTNIDRTLFEKAAAEFPHFKIQFRNSGMRMRVTEAQMSGSQSPITKISRVYAEVGAADLCALFLDNRLLEISLNKASATQLMNLKVGTPVLVQFGLSPF